MIVGPTRVVTLMLGLALAIPTPVIGGQAPVAVTVDAGRPLEVALDRHVTISHVGQPVTGTLVDPIYAYDRLVLPAGTHVHGHVARLIQARVAARTAAMLSGDFSPHREVVLTFDALVLQDGREIPIATHVSGGIARVQRQVAGGEETAAKTGAMAKARDTAEQQAHEAAVAAKQRARDAIAAITRPGRWERFKEAAITRLPYHRQSLTKGAVYVAELTAPIAFGHATPIALADGDGRPAPASVLTARLVTPLNSSKTGRGTPIEAIVTEPVFSVDHRLILPEGARLTGEVTFAARPRWFHRNGQLRFLFERVGRPESGPSGDAPLLASLFSIQTSADDAVAVDDEGGTSITNHKTRFIAPALAVLALRGTFGRRHTDDDGDANDLPGAPGVPSQNFGSRAVGGFLGFSVAGIVLAQVSRPVGITLAVVGVVKTIYSNVISKGRDVSFPAETPVQLLLAPGPGPTR